MSAIAVALIAAHGGIGFADATPVAALAQLAGQHMTLNGVRVTSVPADEGFWVDSDHGAVWVQIDTARESPYDVDAGDVVNVSGQVVRHDANFPARVGVTPGEDAAELTTAGAHLEVPLSGVTFAGSRF